jgi:hypothetical protein
MWVHEGRRAQPNHRRPPEQGGRREIAGQVESCGYLDHVRYEPRPASS